MKDSIDDMNIPHSGSSIAETVTISMGVASVVPERGSNYSELINQVDRALYTAKQTGRNKISTYP